MNLDDFLKDQSIKNKSELARIIGVSPQSLNQFTKKPSNRFLFLLKVHFPDFDVRFDRNKESYLFEKINKEDSGIGVGGVIVHDFTREELLQKKSIAERAAIYSFIAASQIDKFNVFFQDMSKQFIVFAEYSNTSETKILGIFPSESIPNFALNLVQIENDYL